MGNSGPVVSTLSGKCMSTAGPYAGSPILLEDCDGSPRQNWTWAAGAANVGIVVNGESGMCLDAGSPLPPPCMRSPYSTMAFCNASLDVDTRINDLLSRLTNSSKFGMFNTQSGGAPELGLGPYQWWSEALHGVAGSPGVNFGGAIPGATSFPQVCTTAMSFNASLFRAIGSAISTEARAMNNNGRAGLTFWTPNVNIFRDPRWGRGQETPGEDPLMNAVYAKEFIPGMQEGEDPRYIKASACCKHYAAYSLEDWNGTDRHHFNAVVTDQDLYDTYFPAFQSCAADARSSGMMCSYNEVNGVPSCASFFLNTQVFRQLWGFDGYITSDCGAVSDIIDTHKYTNTSDATVKAVLTSGMDIGCDGYLPPSLPAAVADGAVTADNINAALYNLFKVRFRLGMFDPPANQPYLSLGPDTVCTADHIALAKNAAQQGITLLKNTLGAANALPLSTASVKKLAVVGPSAATSGGFWQGNYYGNPCFGITSLSSALGTFATVSTTPGCKDGVPCTDTSDFANAAAMAAAADATVVVVGNDQGQESEGHDRTIVALPGSQADLITQVCAAAAGKPCVVVVLSGSSVDLAAAYASSAVTSIIFGGYPGQSGPDAVAEALFGVFSPAGRLVQTFYQASFVNSISMFEMNMRPGPSAFPPGTSPGRTYRFYTGAPVFTFGFGLHYTTMQYSPSGPTRVSMAATHAFLAREQAAHPEVGTKFTPLVSEVVVNYWVNVTNIGSMDSDDAVLGFLEPPGAGTQGVPLQELFAFQRVHVPAGQTVSVYLGLQARHLTRVLEDGSRVPLPGQWKVRFGPWTGNMVHAPAAVGSDAPAYAELSFTAD